MHPTFIGLFPSVGSLVGEEVRGITEAIPTLQASVWLLSSMESLVVTEVGTVIKTLPRGKTLVGLLTCMAPVRNKAMHFPTEAVHKCVTSVGFLCEVQALVVNEFF